jgi:hypothetical protein
MLAKIYLENTIYIHATIIYKKKKSSNLSMEGNISLIWMKIQATCIQDA